MFATLDGNQVDFRHEGKSLPCFFGAQIVVQLGNDRDQAPTAARPRSDIVIRRAMQRRGEKDRPVCAVLQSIREHDLGAEGPTE